MIPDNDFPEREVLGSILSGADIPLNVNAGMFSSNRNKIIFTALEHLKSNCSPDLVILADYLSKEGLLEAAGGAACVAELTNLVPGPSNMDYYCEQLASKSRERRQGVAIRQAAEDFAKGKPAEAIAPDLIEALSQSNKPIRKTSWTAAELLDAEFPRIHEIIPGLITTGISIVAGPPKLGKSWLMLSLAIGAASGSYVLGKISVKKTGVMYLALEDTGRRLQNRLHNLNAPSLENLEFHTEWPSDVPGLETYLNQHRDIRLVIIDTWGKFGQVQDYSDYAETTRKVAELKRIADELDVAICLVHHTRKGLSKDSGDWLDSVLGSQGLSGAADSTLMLRRRRGTNQAELLITGRDIIEKELVLSFDVACGGWALNGEKHDVQESQARQDILDWLKENGPHSPKQIHEGMAAEGEQRSISTVKTLLNKMVQSGSLINIGGVYSAPQSPEIPPGCGAQYDYAFTEFLNKGRSREEADREARAAVCDYAAQMGVGA